MKYFKFHDNEPAVSPYPTIYFIEVDDMRCERRKLVIHLDGRTAFADEHEWHGTGPARAGSPKTCSRTTFRVIWHTRLTPRSSSECGSGDANLSSRRSRSLARRERVPMTILSTERPRGLRRVERRSDSWSAPPGRERVQGRSGGRTPSVSDSTPSAPIASCRSRKTQGIDPRPSMRALRVGCS